MEVYSDLFRQGNPEAFCDHVFRTFDHDNSGHIDFKEFMLAISVTSAKDPKEKLTWAFTMYDKNKDGTIEKSEMVDIITVRPFFQVILTVFNSLTRKCINHTIVSKVVSL